MEEFDYDKILEELMQTRQSIMTSVRPSGTGSLISGGSSGYVNYDFVSLYPRTMSIKIPSKNGRRKRKIKNMFPDIEE